jgi:hypothetical protein
MKTRIRKPKFQEKVVFSVEIENENLESTYYPESEEYVEAFIGSMLKKRNLTTEKIFLGGEKECLYRFLSALVENYHYREVYMDDNTELYEGDPDFD